MDRHLSAGWNARKQIYPQDPLFRLLIARARVNYSLFSTNVDLKRKRPLHEQLLISAGKVLPVEKIFHTDRELKRLDRMSRNIPMTVLHTW